MDDEDYPSSKSDSSDQEDQPNPKTQVSTLQSAKNLTLNIKVGSIETGDEDDEIGDGLRITSVQAADPATQLERTNSSSFIPQPVERRRRKLPEIPKNKKCKTFDDFVVREELIDRVLIKQLPYCKCAVKHR